MVCLSLLYHLQLIIRSTPKFLPPLIALLQPQHQQELCRNLLATMTREASKLTANLHFFFCPSKSNTCVSYLALQKTFYCDFPSFSAPKTRGPTKKILVKYSNSFPFVNLPHHMQPSLFLSFRSKYQETYFTWKPLCPYLL